MTKDERQLRKTNNLELLGYWANYHGEKVIAIMKGKECKECLGIVYPEQLLKMMDTGPCINLDNIIMR